MSTVNFTLTGVELTVANTVLPTVTPQPAQTVPGGLYPMHSRGYQIDEYRLMAGWPVPVPDYDIHCPTLVSADGSTFTERDSNIDITTSAVLRWVADPTFFDTGTLSWAPIQDGTGLHPNFVSSVDFMPVLINDYSYRVNDEMFVTQAINFDSDTQNHMWADFTATLGGAPGYTLIMVMSPNSTYGNNVDVPYNGLWCPGRATPGSGDTFSEAINDTWMSVTIQGGYLYLSTESRTPTRGISIQPQLNSNAPMYLAIVFGRPTTYFYCGPGPDGMRVKSMDTGSIPLLMDDGVVLGRSTGDILHTADMALFDVGIYADQLTANQVHDEFALLSAVYGGNS